MPSRIIPFAGGEYYHIFNRGVAKMPIFLNIRDYRRFIKTMSYYQLEGPKPKFSNFSPLTTKLNPNKKIVDIVCYCLMPNHFHFLLRQKREQGITEFISKLSNSFTKYFNTKNKRVGPLFQGEFKAVHIGSSEELIHVSRYIHLNPLIDYVAKDILAYKWSSYPEYAGIEDSKVCVKDTILGQFNSTEEYVRFVLDQEDYGRELERIKHQLLDLEY